MKRRLGPFVGRSRTEHYIRTPEGVRLPLSISLAGDRVTAFVLDSILQVIFILVLFYFWSKLGFESALLNFICIVSVFVLWNLYFILFELRWQGQTPGKRLKKLRVVDRLGGVLTADAVIVRNLMRQVELFIPLTVLMAPKSLFGNTPGILTTISLIWFMAFLLFPIFNSRRLRVGDLVGGTIVIYAPKVELSEDLGVQSRSSSRRRALEFEGHQLEHYGEYELQVLESLLRRLDDGTASEDSLFGVSERIRNKIDWTWPAGSYPDDANFLHAFYAAQREHLEQALLMGNRREFKKK